MKTMIVMVMLIMTICFCFTLCEGSNDVIPWNVIIIGWDGAGRDNIKNYLQQGLLPNMNALSAQGTIVAIDNLRTTDTKSGWAQILTGYEPEVTGVFSNHRYGPIPKGLTIFERLKQFFGPGFVTVAIIGKKNHVDADPSSYQEILEQDFKWIKRKIKKYKSEPINVENPPSEFKTEFITQDGKYFKKIPAKPFYITRQNMNEFINGLLKDKVVGTTALEYIDLYQRLPFMFFIHFAEIDHQGHKFGEGSRQQVKAYVSADYWTGKIIDKLKELDLYDHTLIYVTSDHGFDVGRQSHKDAPYVFLATNDTNVLRRGYRVDITATILHRLGIDIQTINPPLDGKPLTIPFEQVKW
ncbi:alkaline phosphatase family protein [candidate division CSSED10-310 bacterium]|uniref:Alkaline phosphatase family protein n=1 Tax=candidate division CSSED10-310 bacterium TaxID=2855610 RepID=A0ABV6YWZ3_UNCC1